MAVVAVEEIVDTVVVGDNGNDAMTTAVVVAVEVSLVVVA